MIDVEYELLPPIMSIDEALAQEKVRIHEYGSGPNVHRAVAYEFGDVEEAFAEADLVQEDLFYFEGNTHLPLEQHAAVAQWSPDGKLTLWSSTQTPHYLHRVLAKVLQMPAAHIRVIATPAGGGFGGKSDPFSHEIIVCKLAQLTGRPVKIGLTREEVFYCHRGRHPVLMGIKTGVKKDGEILGMHFRSYLDGGAYGSYGAASLLYTGALQTLTYKVPRYKFEGLRVFTNKPPGGPKRGHGTPQSRYALECHLDKIAGELGLDPAKMRRRWVVAEYTKTANHLTVTTCGLEECIDRVVEASGWQEKHRRLPYGKGVGFACSSYMTGAGLPIYRNDMPHSGAIVKVDRGGGVTILCGAAEIGQGSDSVLASVVAEELGIDPVDIRVVTADTDLTPVDLGSYSSRVTLMAGTAALEAATKIRTMIHEAVAGKLEVEVERLVSRDGWVFVRGDPERRVSFAEAAVLAETMHGTLSSAGSYTPPRRGGAFRGSGVGPSVCYSYSACVVEVGVDPATGEVKVDEVWIAHDVGRALNPNLVEGQVEGSVYMGLGEALMEEQVFRKGLHKIPSMLEYKSPTTLEMPEVHTILVETLDPEGLFGAKEAGQGPLLPVIPAVANAVYDAVGVRIDEVPISPEKVLKALELMRQGKTPRIGPAGLPAFTFPDPQSVDSAFGQPADPSVKRREDPSR
jgi:4-hydroxybenzoyl-CoA reductase alpha subunit